MRKTVTDYTGNCIICGNKVSKGETVYWEFGKGGWHTECDTVDKVSRDKYSKELLDLKRILDELVTQNKRRKLGFILLPFIIGYFILKKSTNKIKELLSEKNKITIKVQKVIRKSEKYLEETYRRIIKEDTYLIYSVRSNLDSKVNQFLNELRFLQTRKNFFSQNRIILMSNLFTKFQIPAIIRQ